LRIKDLKGAKAAAEDPFQILAGQALLLDPELDRFNGADERVTDYERGFETSRQRLQAPYSRCRRSP
jgi:hypothetical protein